MAHAQSASPVVGAEPRIEPPEEPVAFEAVRPGPPSTVSRAALPEVENLPDLTAISSWAIPPVPWGGNTSSNYGWNGGSNMGNMFTTSQTVNLRASSYIYQPWYAQVSGDLGLLTGSSKQSSTEARPGSSSRNTGITYGGNLALFPQSRFPFQAFVQTSDSRAAANSMNSQYNATRIGARQSYRPPIGPENYSASADRSIVTSGPIRSVVDLLQGSFATSFDDQSVSTNARFSRNLGDVGGQGSKLISLSGAHSWRSDEELMVASSANYTNNQVSVLTDTGLFVNNSQIMQAGSSATWIPDEDLPLTISGGGNLLHINTVTAMDQAYLTNLNGYATANYRLSDNLAAVAGVMLAQDASAGIHRFFLSENASLSYVGNPLIIGDYSYNWGTGGGINNQTVSNSNGNRGLFSQIQHSLMREIALSESSNIGLHASQGFSLSTNSTSGHSGVLSHAGGASWRHGFGDSLVGALSATITDSMSIGNFSSHFRSLTTQGSMQALLSSRSALTANLNFMFNQQLKTPQITTTTTATTTASSTPTTLVATPTSSSNTLNGSGQVSYTHRSPFDISNLIYSASLQVNASQTNLRVVGGDPNFMPWQSGTVLLQNVDYRFGRLVFRATASLASFNGKKNASLLFTISREFGDF